MRLLAGDVGGTHTRLALYDGETMVARETYISADYPDLAPVVSRFLKEGGHPTPDAGCVGVAGPVRHGRVRLTNVSWQLDAEELGEALGFPLALVNDFHAQAAAIPYLDLSADVVSLGDGERAADGEPIAVLGPGTGLGEAILLPDERGGHRVLPTEGGHGRFAPRDEREIGLLRSLWQTYPEHVSVERVLSGPGLTAIYDHLRGDAPRRPEMATTEPPAVITTQALQRTCPVCVETVELFVGVLGDEAANLALKCNAGGGVFIAGGIAPRIQPYLVGAFRRAFIAKGRFSGWLRTVPTYLVTHPDSGLLGAWAEARRHLGVTGPEDRR